MNNTAQCNYTKFQEWLADCPTQIEDYKDNVDHVIIRFDLPLKGESNNNSGKVYPEVDDVPEQVYKDWLYNKEVNQI